MEFPGAGSLPAFCRHGRRVTRIGSRVFRECRTVTSVTIPESMTSLNDSVFSRCYSLTSVTVPASVTGIGEHVFREDEALTVRAPAGSAAEEYCRENGIRFERLE